ncbi:unnamed protein product, partial [Meganyctiphanes norvegica]
MQKRRASTIPPPSWKEQGYIPARYAVSFLAFLGMVFNYMLRVNINFAIVAMVKPSANESDSGGGTALEVCGFNDTSHHDDEEGEFEWDEFTQSLITGAFFWGYIWTQIPGGRLAEVMGAKRVFGGALTLACVMTCLVPVAAHAGYGVLIAVRVLLGISEGATFPSTHALLASWAPPLERSTLSTIIYAAQRAAEIMFYMLHEKLFPFGLEALDYVTAGITMVWVILWFLLMSDKPEDFRWIKKVEVDYINQALGDSKYKKAPPVPWRAALTSVPFWAILVAGVGNNWGFYTLLTDLPLYMKNMLGQDLKSTAWKSGLPYLGMWIVSLLVSSIGDNMQKRGYITTTVLRKVANTIAHVGPAICMVCLSFVECDTAATFALLFASVSLMGGIYTGFMVNHIDIAPNYAGTLFGITNAAATIPGWLAPMTVGALTNGNQTFGQWRKVFYISAAIFTVDALFYIIFGTGTEQEWNKIASPKLKGDEPDSGHREAEGPSKGTEAASLGTWSQIAREAVAGADQTKYKSYDDYVSNPNFRRSGSHANPAFQED